MATKKFIGYTTTAKTVYGIIERQADSYRLNDADGAFAAAPTDPYVSFTEHSVIKGEYVLSESRTVWNDGMYKCTVYEQSGGSPVPASDLVVAYQYMYVVSDAEVVSESSVTSILADTGTDGVVVATASKTGYALSTAGVDAILDDPIEGALTFRQALRLFLSALAGKSSGGGTATLIFQDYADAKARITATVDSNGNRTALTLDGT